MEPPKVIYLIREHDSEDLCWSGDDGINPQDAYKYVRHEEKPKCDRCYWFSHEPKDYPKYMYCPFCGKRFIE